MSKFKSNLPNFLTFLRILMIPLILYLILINNIIGAIVVTAVSSLTDLFDGYFARKWNTVSSLGAKLDTIADKLFASSILIVLIFYYPFLVFNLFLEISITIINMYSHYKNNNTDTKMIGKIKTTILFCFIILGLFSLEYSHIGNILLILNAFLIPFQLICILSYYKLYKESEKLKQNLSF